jgi:hypothetical protein
VVADFNGDGLGDLAIANYNSGTVSVVFGNGDGTFQPPVDTAVGETPYSIAAADLNRDGRVDLLLSRQNSAYLQVLLGAGDGTFAPAVAYYSGLALVVRVADFNGDELADVAALGEQTLSILVGNGDGTVRLQMTGFSTLFYASEMAIADFTSDGWLDVAVAGDGRTLVSPAGIGIALLYNTTPSEPSGAHLPRSHDGAGLRGYGTTEDAKRNRAEHPAGDVNTLLLDRTGPCRSGIARLRNSYQCQASRMVNSPTRHSSRHPRTKRQKAVPSYWRRGSACAESMPKAILHDTRVFVHSLERPIARG